MRSACAASIAATICSTPDGRPARSSSSSANAIRIPPDDGGGLVSISRPRKRAATGSRAIGS